ncbi:MAG: hypothetical protein KDA98_06875 [Acidimicrobiales bacterium]|nr:hypothetical protein [Acidimicrobiales bacterium]
MTDVPMFGDSSVQPAEPADDDKRRKLLWLAGVLAVLVVLILGLLAFCSKNSDDAVYAGPDSTDDDPTYEKADEVGLNPFLAPADLAEIAEVTYPPDPPKGLFGGTLENTCDPELLADYLDANPSKAKAWAGVQGIETSEIRSYLATLTPTVLTEDTLVTNHGYKSGTATPVQATLEAGTAVLVDDDGVPRARCYCGNPLLPPKAPPSPEPSSASTCLSIAAPLWLGFDGAPATPGTGGMEVAPRPWSVNPTGKTTDVAGTTYVQLNVDFTNGWLYSTGNGDYNEVWTTADSLNAPSCATKPVCYGGTGEVLPDLEGTDPLSYPKTTMTLTGATQNVGPIVWQQVEIITGEVEPEFTFAWVQASSITDGACAATVPTTTAAPTTLPPVTPTAPPNGCTPGTFDPAGKTVTYSTMAEFNDDQGSDTAYVFQQGGTTFVQFELSTGEVSKPVDLGKNFNGGTRSITAGGVASPTGAQVDVLVLEDRSTAGGAGNTGTSLVVGLRGCDTVHVPIDGTPSDVVSSFTAASPTALSCEQGINGEVDIIVWQGTPNAAGTGLDYAVTSYGYDDAQAVLNNLGTTTLTGLGGPPGNACY